MSADGSGPEVVAFGADREPVRVPRSRLLAAVLADRRLVPLFVGLAALAALASLVSEWYVVVNPARLGEPVRETRFGVGDGGGLGTAYLVGLFALAAATSLVLTGPPAVRRAARAAGLAVAGTLFAVVLAARTTFEDFVNAFFYLSGEEQTVTYGRGVTAAFATTILAALGLYLAGRALPPAGAAPVAAPASGADPGDNGVRAGGRWPEWSWRRPRAGVRDAAEVELADSTPLDLTVEPASPFARPDGSDRPDRPDDR
jgi:hypothetical protein